MQAKGALSLTHVPILNALDLYTQRAKSQKLHREMLAQCR